jgi:hypothetical protein
MPRGVPKNKEDKTKANIVKAEDGRIAEKMLALLEVLRQERKDKTV